MFAYLLILLELAFLYLVFWNVFIREPRPLEIKENLWGYYAHPEATADGINLRKARRKAHADHTLLRSRNHGVRRKLEQRNDSALKHGWGAADESKETSLLASLLAYLGKQLMQLSAILS